MVKLVIMIISGFLALSRVREGGTKLVIGVMIQSQERQKSDALDIQVAFNDIDADPDEDNVDVFGRCRKLLQLLVAL